MVVAMNVRAFIFYSKFRDFVVILPLMTYRNPALDSCPAPPVLVIARISSFPSGQREFHLPQDLLWSIFIGLVAERIVVNLPSDISDLGQSCTSITACAVSASPLLP